MVQRVAKISSQASSIPKCAHYIDASSSVGAEGNATRWIAGEDRLKRQCHREVDAADDEIDFERPEALRLQVVGDRGQFLGRNGRDDAGAEHHQDELAGQRRKHRLQRRHDDDEAEDRPWAQPKRTASLDLPARHGFDTGAHDLGGVGAKVDHHREQRRAVRREAQSEARQAQIDQEQLHQEWRIADRLDVAWTMPRIMREPRGFGPGTRMPSNRPSSIVSADNCNVSNVPRSRSSRLSQMKPKWNT